VYSTGHLTQDFHRSWTAAGWALVFCLRFCYLFYCCGTPQGAPLPGLPYYLLALPPFPLCLLPPHPPFHFHRLPSPTFTLQAGMLYLCSFWFFHDAARCLLNDTTLRVGDKHGGLGNFA